MGILYKRKREKERFTINRSLNESQKKKIKYIFVLLEKLTYSQAGYLANTFVDHIYLPHIQMQLERFDLWN